MIALRLKCKCTDGEVMLAVRERHDGEDIRDYMEHVKGRVGIWHQNRGCPETHLVYMKMPLAAGKSIGEVDIDGEET